MAFTSQQTDVHSPIPEPVDLAAAAGERQQEPNSLWSQVSQRVDNTQVTAAPQADAASSPAASPTDARGPISAGLVEPSLSGSDACSTKEEEQRKDTFRNKILTLNDFIPSTKLGKFDATYWPHFSLLSAVSKVHFNYVQADNTPDALTLMHRAVNGADVSSFFWSGAERRQFESDFFTKTSNRWSFQHQMRSTKPCWPFVAHLLLTPLIVKDKSAAHFTITVHKSTGPDIDYKSAITHPGATGRQGGGNLWGSDVQTEPNFNSTDVARNERQRIERAIASAAVSPVLFAANSAQVSSADVAALQKLAVVLNKKNPSDPAIPINLDGFASRSEGSAGNRRLSGDRIDNVRNILLAAGVTQPLIRRPRGEVGTANDAANQRVDLLVDHTTESRYSSNHFSVAEHEFGHLFGLPDEYQNNTGSGALATAQTNFTKLAQQAGVDGPDKWGDMTASQMSSGVDILPRHYLTLWEALGTMTAPDITKSQWSIV